ncbi:hypothetical protein UCREL1_10394 [Eutypa lata UCREL1]|uniref:F-box domain-containing protein n=1 Tax=Eutypa lata (strain UCR-EL1) TaxID=1287681 RepID=M7T7Q7_EUTLA|nr:hypothetical protein UCREL1_10394 [Eutypa lata UCREL1]
MESILARFRRPTPKPYSTPGMAGPDIISRLPYELREMILAELSLEDISGALSVCRTWRSSWLDDGAWLSLADRWFPGLAERIRISTGADGGDAATAAAAAAAEAAEMFRRALHRIQRRTSGKFASAFQHTMCLECERFFELDKSLPVAEGGVHQFEGLQFSGISTRFPRFMMYNSGRIAWWPEMYGSPFFAIVDDLCTKMRRAYLFPNNGGFRQGYKTAISSRLFVMCRGTTVDAWHFTLNCLRSVEIPEEFDRCIAEGERILLISNNGPTPEKDGTLQRRYKVDLATKDLQGSGDARFAFNPHQRFGTHRNWASEYGGVKRLVGDDDFLLFVDGGNYTAWSFGNDIPEQPLDDGQMRWWKKLR